MIKVENISYTVEHKKILDEISLQVNSGEFVGLIGPNGCGKSTLLRNIYRSLKPDGGAVFLDGDNIDQISSKAFARKLAIVAQEHEMNFNFKVAEMVMMSRYAHKKFLQGEDREDQKICEEALSKVGMLDFRERDYFTLSGGEKQRVILAMAFARQSVILILDEPTNHLDIGHQLSIMDTLKNHSGMTIFSSIHDLNIAAKYCDRLILMDRGSVVLVGEKNQVMESPLLEEVFQVEIATLPLPNGHKGIYFLKSFL